ncbi:MAG: dimethylarginine dimethylaminohydrolase family protein [Desulfotignum sp.]
MFTRAMVKTPCKNMVNGISHANLGTPDHALAVKQHERYIQALASCGLEVIVLDPDEAFPDSTFIEDTCLVTGSVTVITRPGAVSRQGEIHAVTQAMARFDRPMAAIQAPATLDAGDVMMVQDHFYVGLSDRTNAAGISRLKEILAPYGYTVSPIELTTVLHLKTGVSYLENNCLLAWGEFVTKPELAGFTILPVDDTESYAANCVWINDRVLVPQGFDKTRDMIENQGYETIAVDVSEFRKLDGGLSCLSLRF